MENQMKILILSALLSFSNVFAVDTTCTTDLIKQKTIEQLKAMASYEGEEGKIKMEDVKIGNVWSYPDLEHPTFYYVPVTMRMESTSTDGSFKTENGMWLFWFDAITCEDTQTIFDDLKPLSL